jgi:hypothetical protein
MEIVIARYNGHGITRKYTELHGNTRKYTEIHGIFLL